MYFLQQYQQHTPTTTPNNNNSQQVQGLLLPTTLSPVELAIFDYFESEEYERQIVQVELINENNSEDVDSRGGCTGIYLEDMI